MRLFTRFTIICICIVTNFSAFCQECEIYVSDAGNFNNPPWQIVKFDQNGDNPEVFIKDSIVWPQDILFLDDNTVLISSLTANGRITQHDADSGDYLNDFATGLAGPTRMKVGPDGLLYVLLWSNSGLVMRYDLDGTPMGAFTSEVVPQSIGLDWDSEGNLYVSSYGDATVRKFDTDGNDLGLFIDSDLDGPTNIWFDDNGDLLVVDYNGGAVKRFDSQGVFQGIFIEGIDYGEGVAFLPNGNILIGSGGTGCVLEYEPDGGYIGEFIAPGGGNLLTPNVVVVRKVTQVSVLELGLEQSFVQPTVGRRFFLQSEVAVSEVADVEVCNAAGLLVDHKTVENTLIWDATVFPKGVYFIRAQREDGAVWVDRVVVE